MSNPVSNQSGSTNKKLLQANAVSRYEITKDDLPLHCPMDNMTLWNSHPRVFLPVEETGEARCPYCGAVYVLKDQIA
ncbi:MAG: zinc-finger domain-containing protein [Gammaproteobacteria bacterium]|nr:zinc-finger domain-containing protein [Gammaproteobacteria bacterium]